MHPLRTTAILVLLLVASAGAYAVAAPKQSGNSKDARSATATLRDAGGKAVGTVKLRTRGGVTTVSARARSLPPGFHGFHVHAVGTCARPDFKSAMGHLKAGDQGHGEHLGDLPSLLVQDDGTARLSAQTDKFSVADLRRGDGAAVMVHAKPDNFGNVPDRYVAEPDQETKDTGDAGDRIACAQVR